MSISKRGREDVGRRINVEFGIVFFWEEIEEILGK